MEIVVCPACKVKVLPSKDGVCPSCRHVIAQQDSSSELSCPSCGKLLAPNAVLCVDCGYHLQQGVHLGVSNSTGVEQPDRSDDGNPYQPPSDLVSALELDADLQELTPAAIRKAEAIAADGESVYLVLVGILCCGVLPAIAAPWYAYRLYSWYGMFRRYRDLRYPNSLSPNGALAVRFNDARIRLWIGLTPGLILWAILALVTIVDFVRVLAYK